MDEHRDTGTAPDTAAGTEPSAARKVLLGVGVAAGAVAIWLAGAVAALVGLVLVIAGVASFTATDVPPWWAVVALVLGTAGMLARLAQEFSNWVGWAVVLPVLAVACTAWLVLGPRVGVFA